MPHLLFRPQSQSSLLLSNSKKPFYSQFLPLLTSLQRQGPIKNSFFENLFLFPSFDQKVGKKKSKNGTEKKM